MKKFTCFLLIAVLVSSACSDERFLDLVQFKSGKWGSAEGGFSLAFPSKPVQHVTENFLGDFSWYTHSFSSRFGNEQMYGVTFMEVPAMVWSVFSPEDLFAYTIQYLSNAVGGYALYSSTDVDLKPFDLVRDYVLVHPDRDLILKVRLIRFRGHLYQVFYYGSNQLKGHERVNDFITSFRRYSPNK